MKKVVSLIVLVTMLLGTIPVTSFANEYVPALPKVTNANMEFKDEHTYFVITPDQITDVGGWYLQNGRDVGSYRERSFLDNGGALDTGVDPANFKFKVPKSGEYYVFVHSRDFANETPGQRNFYVQVDGGGIGTCGLHFLDGWGWEKMEKTYLSGGEHTISFLDGSKYGRFDLIMITSDSQFFPGNTLEELQKLENEYIYDASKITVEKVDVSEGRPDDEIAVKFNDEWMKFDVPPMLINDRTMVPMRAIFEALGCYVEWDEETETASGTRNGKKVSVTVGSNVGVIEGASVRIDQSAVLVNDRTLVPIRFVSEAFNAKVEWDNDNQIVIINAGIPANSYYIVDSSYSTYGTWQPEYASTDGAGALIGTQPDASDGKVVTIDDATTEGVMPAIANFDVGKEGDYKIWVRGRDFATNQQGTRHFKVYVNGEDTARTYGQHAQNGYQWEDGGIVHLKQGTNTVEVHDTSGFFARLAGIFITDDLEYTPSNNHSSLVSISCVVDPSVEKETARFPVWATKDVPATETLTIASDKVKVNFYKVSDATNGDFIQNEILINDNGNFVVSKSKTEKFGLVQIRNDRVVSMGETEGKATIRVEYEKDGVEMSYVTKELYRMGDSEWLIPVKAEQVAENKVVVTYSDGNGTKVSETWEIDDIDVAPKVTINAEFNKDGYYTFAFSNGDEVFDEDFDAVTIPFKTFAKRVPPSATMLVARYMFTPMSTVTISADKSGIGKALTKGVVVDGTEVPEWTYEENCEYMAGLRGASKGVIGTIAAPIMGNDDSKFKAGDTYSFSYRPVGYVGDWFESYKAVAEEVFNYHDARSNYYASLNDAIYNITDLMLDDLYGGWDAKDMAHYNIEGRDVTTVSNPLAILQRYMLTEDEEILDKRAIPTLAFLIGKDGCHFKKSSEESVDSVGYTPNPPLAIGGFNKTFPSSTFMGAYKLTSGMNPVLLGVAEETKDSSRNAYFSAQNALELYKFTGDSKYLEDAKKATDKYIAETVENEAYLKEERIWRTFVNVTYYPDLSIFLDMYEATGDKKYLDAAEKTGQMLAACTWVPGLDNGKAEGEYTIKADAVYDRVKKGTNVMYYNWHGQNQWRVGGEYGNFKEEDKYIRTSLLPDEETVPAWLPTRVGLGLEQPFSFQTMDSGHVMQSQWAPNMIRLSEYTGDDYYYTIAKNAIIGRFGNYPGYYVNNLVVHHMKPEYPYVGPDTTSIYYHHIPPFAAMLEDFLITDAWARSDKAIEFPKVIQQAYAWFTSAHYGFESGKVYDMEDMWLWNDRGIVNPDSVKLNYLPAKKDGLLAVAFMNTDNADVTSVISLGDKIEGGATYSGTAAVYDASGNKSTLEVKDGKFDVTVPAKGILTVALNIDTVKAPAYASYDYSDNTAELGATVTEFNRGRAYTLQLTPAKYYAYVFTTDMDEKQEKTAKAEFRAVSATLKYTVNGKTETVVCEQYPFDFLIPVEDADASFEFEVSVTKADGTTESLGGGTLMTAEKSEKEGITSTLPAVYVH